MFKRNMTTLSEFKKPPTVENFDKPYSLNVKYVKYDSASTNEKNISYVPKIPRGTERICLKYAPLDRKVYVLWPCNSFLKIYSSIEIPLRDVLPSVERKLYFTRRTKIDENGSLCEEFANFLVSRKIGRRKF